MVVMNYLLNDFADVADKMGTLQGHIGRVERRDQLCQPSLTSHLTVADCCDQDF